MCSRQRLWSVAAPACSNNTDERTELSAPRPTESVYREDCTQCFDDVDQADGLNVCLYCFNGGCAGERNHARLHYETQHHPLALNIKRKRKHVSRDEPPQKMTKLAIAAETEQDKYDITTRVECYECKIDDVDKSSGKLPQVVDGIMKANTFAKQEEVKAWEQEMTACEHTLCLEQDQQRNIESNELGHCAKCDLKDNLWLCLTCGSLGCGRQQYGGTGGNGHGLAHTKEAGHPVAVKLGSLTADGQADLYCYACDEERVDPEIRAHLANFGINLADRQKTEKSLAEMQIDQNLRWEFSMQTEDGKELQPLFGPGYTGLKNLGNSCYMASTLQCLFAFPEFEKRYHHPSDRPPVVSKPADDLETQMRKVADGLLSGRYSKPDSDVITTPDTSEVPHQKGLAPSMLKHLIGKGHAEFSSMRQQDAFELLMHLFQTISRSSHPVDTPNPMNSFKFVMEHRLQCLGCRKVRYQDVETENIGVRVPVRRIAKMTDANVGDTNGEKNDDKEEFEPVTMKECLDIFTAPEKVELTCSSCGSKDGFSKRGLFKTFPDILAVAALRFDTVVNWVPTKLDVPVIVGKDPIPFDQYKSYGLQPGEEELPEGDAAGSSNKFVPNELALSQLEAMGFPKVRAEKALKKTGNSDAETAMGWLIEHMEDPDIDVPEPEEGAGGGGAASVDPASVEELGNMGFSAPQARQALKETGGNMERAVDWLFSHPDAQGDFGDDAAPALAETNAPSGKTLPGSEDMPAKMDLQSIVCHKGTSIHSG